MRRYFIGVAAACLAFSIIGIGTASAKSPTLVSVSKTWNLYTNYTLGFSMKTPKTYYADAVTCAMTTVDGTVTQTIGPKSVAPGIVWSGTEAYIVAPYHYESTIATTNDCVKQLHTGAYVKSVKTDSNVGNTSSSLPGWTITVRTIANNAALTKYIQKKYGSACTWTKKISSQQAGVYDVTIVGDGKDPDVSHCFVNEAYHIKYSPKKHKMANWDMGQYIHFSTMTGIPVYDTSMSSSFKFL